MKAKIVAVASAIAVLALAPQVCAEVASMTYQGFVTTDAPVLDVDNLFGGGDISGDAVTATYIYDTSIGYSSVVHNEPGTNPPVPFPGPDVEVDGFDGGPSPILSAIFTIDGHSYSYTPDYQENASTGYGVFNYTDGENDIFGTADAAFALSGADSQVVFQTDLLTSTSLSSAYSSTGFGLGYLDTAYDLLGDSDQLNFEFGSVAIAPVSAAPEPTTWALMIAGLGVAGLALRRRRDLKPVGCA